MDYIISLVLCWAFEDFDNEFEVPNTYFGE